MPQVTLLSQSANWINALIPLVFAGAGRRLSTGFSTDCVERKNALAGSNEAMSRRGDVGHRAKKR
jgi:hypothetical protein